MSDQTAMSGIAKSLVFAVFLAVGMGASTAFADQGYLELRNNALVSSQAEFHAARGGPTARGGGLALGYEPSAVRGLRILGIYDVDGFSTGRFQNNELNVDWGRQRAMAAADYGIALIGDWFRPLARLGIGYSYQTLELAADGVTYRDGDHGASALLAGGLEARIGGDTHEGTSALGRFSLGINALVGYLWQTTASFDSMRTTEEIEDDDPWQRTTYDAGALNSSGITWTVGFSLGYRFGD